FSERLPYRRPKLLDQLLQVRQRYPLALKVTPQRRSAVFSVDTPRLFEHRPYEGPYHGGLLDQLVVDLLPAVRVGYSTELAPVLPVDPATVEAFRPRDNRLGPCFVQFGAESGLLRLGDVDHALDEKASRAA